MLLEAGLLPGAVRVNRGLRYVCKDVHLKVENTGTAFTRLYRPDEVVTMPIGHMEGNYTAPPETLTELEYSGGVVFRYCDPEGNVTDEANPNGATAGIAGISNREGNVVGLMPHPDRCAEGLLGNDAGRKMFESAVAALGDSLKSVPTITEELIADHNLTAEEYSLILEILGREPNIVELGVFSVMWSEHCSYKSSRVHLKKLPTTGPRVIQGPGENAGIVDIGDGLAVAFKMESHNHPSFIEPYQGAATGVGGILRDIFTMGARPIASLDSLRFGRLDAPRMRHLVDGVVRGIAGYGNCIGIPTVGGETTFHPGYDGNILVNVINVGIVAKDRIFQGRAEGVGNPVIYVGSKTGRDGIHGATMASEEFAGDETQQKRPTVQVGDPFTEKLLMEACLELFRTDAVVGIQDMGAAGLTSSSFEMAGRAGNGLEIDLSKVPVRESGMTPYEILLSESQERMLLVARARPARHVSARSSASGSSRPSRSEGSRRAVGSFCSSTGASWRTCRRRRSRSGRPSTTGRGRPSSRSARAAGSICPSRATTARPCALFSPRRTSRRSRGSGRSTTTWSGRTPSSGPAATPAYCGSRGRPRRSRSRAT